MKSSIILTVKNRVVIPRRKAPANGSHLNAPFPRVSSAVAFDWCAPPGCQEM